MLKQISFAVMLLGSLFLQGCLELGSDQGQWDKASIDKNMIGTWLKSDQTDLITIKDQGKGYLEAFDSENTDVADLKTLHRGSRTYLLARMDMESGQAPVWSLVEYSITADRGILYGLNVSDPELNETYFKDNKEPSDYVRVFRQLDEATLKKIDAIFATPSWIKVVAEYRRCNAECVKTWLSQPHPEE